MLYYEIHVRSISMNHALLSNICGFQWKIVSGFLAKNESLFSLALENQSWRYSFKEAFYNSSSNSHARPLGDLFALSAKKPQSSARAFIWRMILLESEVP